MIAFFLTVVVAFLALFALATVLRAAGCLLCGDFRGARDAVRLKNILGGNLSSMSSFGARRHARYRYSTDLETREAVRRDAGGDR